MRLMIPEQEFPADAKLTPEEQEELDRTLEHCEPGLRKSMENLLWEAILLNRNPVPMPEELCDLFRKAEPDINFDFNPWFNT